MSFGRQFQPGQIVRFTYTGQGGDSADRFKEILILNANWKGKIHAIDLKRLTPAEREVLSEILDPALREKRSRLPLVNDIKRRIDAINEIKNPITFYARFVKVFLRGKDAYRTYWPQNLSNPSIVKEMDIRGKMINRKPLFRKI